MKSFIAFEASFMLSGATFVVQLQKYLKMHFRLHARCQAVEDSYLTVRQKSDGQKTYALASE